MQKTCGRNMAKTYSTLVNLNSSLNTQISAKNLASLLLRLIPRLYVHALPLTMSHIEVWCPLMFSLVNYLWGELRGLK